MAQNVLAFRKPAPSPAAYIRPGFDAATFMMSTLDGWAGYAFASLDYDGGVLLLNRRMQDFTGYTAAELVEGGFLDRLFPGRKNRDRILSSLRELMAGTEPNRVFHWTIRTRDGVERTVWSNSVSGVAGEGGPRAVFMSWRDVTEYPGALGYDRATQRGFQELVESAPAIIVRFRTRDRRCVYINRAVGILTGFQPAAFYREPGLWHRLIAPDDRPRFEAAFRAVSEGATREFDCRLQIGERELCLSQKLYPIQDDAGVVFAIEGIGHDLSDRRQLERRLNQLLDDKDAAHTALQARMRDLETANEQLRSLDRFKSEILANVSHELRTPLVTLCGYAELILDTGLGSINRKQRQALEVMKRSGRRLSTLIENMLEYARLEDGRLVLRRQRIDLRSHAREAAEELSGRLGTRGIRFRMTLGRRPPIVIGDPMRIQLLFRNLLGNAEKFTEDRGKITLSVSARGGMVAVVVHDTGIGIPSQHHARIFDRFYQVDSSPTRRHAGAGLGLAIVREVVELHGGTIHVHSTPGEGSRFEVLLPLRTPQRRKTRR